MQLGSYFHGYGLIVGLAIWLLIELSAKKYRELYKTEVEEKIYWIAGMGGVVGARAYHVLSGWQYYYANPIKILFVWEGGLSIWGAIIGAILAVILIQKGKWVLIRNFLESVASALPLAQALGRWGNMVNRELVGRYGEPLFLYESILDLMLFLIMWLVGKRKKISYLGMYLVGYGSIRIVLENFRQENDIWRLGGLPAAGLVSLLAIGLGIICWKQKRS